MKEPSRRNSIRILNYIIIFCLILSIAYLLIHILPSGKTQIPVVFVHITPMPATPSPLTLPPDQIAMTQPACSATSLEKWTIPQGKYIFIETTTTVDGDLIQGDFKGPYVDFPLPGVGPFCPGQIGVLRRGFYAGGAAGQGTHEYVERIYSLPYEGIIGVDGNGTACISIWGIVDNGLGFPFPGQRTTNLSLLTRDSHPILLRSGESWDGIVNDIATMSGGSTTADNIILRLRYQYRVTNYGIQDMGNISNCSPWEKSVWG